MPHCVFLPGTMNDQRLWSIVWPLLPADFDCVHVPLERAASRQAMQQMIGETCHADSHLIGFSMGAYLALEFASLQPRQWRSLSLLAVNSQGLADDEARLRQHMLNWLAGHRYTGMARQRLLQLLHPQQQTPKLMDLIRAMDLELGHDVLLTQLSQTQQRADLSVTLTQFADRLLMIQGEADALIPKQALQVMRLAAAQAEWHSLPATGHVLPLEQPQALAQLLSDFIRRQATPIKMA